MRPVWVTCLESDECSLSFFQAHRNQAADRNHWEITIDINFSSALDFLDSLGSAPPGEHACAKPWKNLNETCMTWQNVLIILIWYNYKSKMIRKPAKSNATDLGRNSWIVSSLWSLLLTSLSRPKPWKKRPAVLLRFWDIRVCCIPVHQHGCYGLFCSSVCWKHLKAHCVHNSNRHCFALQQGTILKHEQKHEAKH